MAEFQLKRNNYHPVLDKLLAPTTGPMKDFWNHRSWRESSAYNQKVPIGRCPLVDKFCFIIKLCLQQCCGFTAGPQTDTGGWDVIDLVL